MAYVDGFLLCVPQDRLPQYRRMAQLGAKVWIEHGALEYRECVCDDDRNAWGATFPRTAKAKPGEVVIFAWIVFPSRAQRDRINAKVMADPRMQPNGDTTMPFDMKRMSYGGFRPLVEKSAKPKK